MQPRRGKSDRKHEESLPAGLPRVFTGLSHGLAGGLDLDESVADPMANVKVYQGPTSAGSARLPGRNNTAVMGDGLASASIVNVPDFPAETGANGEKHERNRESFSVAGQKPGESLEWLHM